MTTGKQMRRSVRRFALLIVTWMLRMEQVMAGASTSHDLNSKASTNLRRSAPPSPLQGLPPLTTSRRHLEDEGVVAAKETYDESDLNPEEQDALWRFFNATRLWASDKHDWFDSDYKLEDGQYDYCQFTGVECRALKDDNEETDQTSTAPKNIVVKLHLKDKDLSGVLPEDVFPALPRLTTFKVDKNKLQGPIPHSLGTLGELRDLDLSHNQFTGNFPSLSISADVKRILLQNNQFEGKLNSKTLCHFERLKELDISGNDAMHGTIPSCFDDFKDLEVLKFDGVGLTGDIPPELCSPDRKMNGFHPNDAYGCDAIACPAGRYEPTLGRQQDDSTRCRRCSNWSSKGSKQDVLGSTTCPERTEEHPTIHPTRSPTQSPNLSMTETPTLAATSTTTDYPATTSFEDESSFTSSPSVAIPDSNIPTGSDPVWMNERLIVEVALLNAHRTLDAPEEMATMESLAQKFLGTLLDKTSVSVLNLTLSSQMTVADNAIPAINRNQVTLIDPPPPPLRHLLVKPQARSSQLPTTNSNAESSRRLQTDARGVLILTIELTMSFLPTTDQTMQAVISSWDQNMDAFVALLLSSDDLSNIFKEGTTNDDPNSIQGSNSSPSGNSNWKLLRWALILAFVAVVSSATLAFRRWYRHHRNEFYKRQHDEGPLQTNSNSSLTSSSPRNSDKRLGETSSNPEDDMLREALDARSAFSCWKHWDTINGVVSEESDGGWNSGSGSGDVPDSYLHESRKSISNLLDPYTREDVWSVAPDHPLCLSTSGNSIHSDSDKEEDDRGIDLRDYLEPPRRIQSADSIIVIATTDNDTRPRQQLPTTDASSF